MDVPSEPPATRYSIRAIDVRMCGVPQSRVRVPGGGSAERARAAALEPYIRPLSTVSGTGTVLYGTIRYCSYEYCRSIRIVGSSYVSRARDKEEGERAGGCCSITTSTSIRAPASRSVPSCSAAGCSDRPSLRARRGAEARGSSSPQIPAETRDRDKSHAY